MCFLIGKYIFKLKGTWPINYHLGRDFFHDGMVILYFFPRKYVDKIMDGYYIMLRSKPKTAIISPLEK